MTEGGQSGRGMLDCASQHKRLEGRRWRDKGRKRDLTGIQWKEGKEATDTNKENQNRRIENKMNRNILQQNEQKRIQEIKIQVL